MFRDPELLRREHPLYRMICTPVEALRAPGQGAGGRHCQSRARTPTLNTEASVAYLGSGSLPTEAIPSVVVSVSMPGLSASDCRRLRLDEACVFCRIEDDLVRLDMRTLTDEQVPVCGAGPGCSTADHLTRKSRN